ncbi:unnamed protein product [Polarella glacialis]|uniref:Uncharacterized protein n=1 Tax=Polarella glacialis TaxID=89957 RepID=A0A813KKC5_POLGL|nr:unnamed protein product [Polarella glacialis]
MKGRWLREVSGDIHFFRPNFVTLSPEWRFRMTSVFVLPQFVTLSPEWYVSFVKISASELFDSSPELSLATDATRDPKLRRVIAAAARVRPLLRSLQQKQKIGDAVK